MSDYPRPEPPPVPTPFKPDLWIGIVAGLIVCGNGIWSGSRLIVQLNRLSTDAQRQEDLLLYVGALGFTILVYTAGFYSFSRSHRFGLILISVLAAFSMVGSVYGRSYGYVVFTFPLFAYCTGRLFGLLGPKPIRGF